VRCHPGSGGIQIRFEIRSMKIRIETELDVKLRDGLLGISSIFAAM
jgi:hypothetical protein